MNALQSKPILLWILLVFVVIAVGASWYKYIYAQNFSYIVEASCDSATQECYQRDCSVDGDCPPNNLAVYRVFQLPGSEFKNCSDNSCSNICPSEVHQCTEIPCSSQSDIDCVGPDTP